MRRFLGAAPAALAELENRARRVCVVFRSCELPPGCHPTTARVGFEVTRSGQAVLYVGRGASYDGGHPELREWLATGEKRFISFGALVAWITTELGPLLRAQQPSPRSVVDLNAV